MLSESDLILNTNFELWKHINMQSQTIYDDKNISKKNLHVLEDDASCVQVGDIEQVTI